MNRKHKLGIMGGTFDPIHIGHLMLAQSAYEELELEKIIFIPAGRPPHKADREIEVTNEQRIDMVRLAIEDDDRFELDTIEMEKQSYSYTYETLMYLTDKNPENEYYFIIGGDSLRDFHKWKKPEEILKYCHIAASYRPDIKEGFEELLEENRKKYRGDFVRIAAPMLEVSSHEIREIIENGKSFRYYIPEKVYKYIISNELYKTKIN